MHFSRYSLQKRKKIALYSAIGFGVLLLIVLVLIYLRPPTKRHVPLSSTISSGYTTILEGAQSYFTNK